MIDPDNGTYIDFTSHEIPDHNDCKNACEQIPICYGYTYSEDRISGFKRCYFYDEKVYTEKRRIVRSVTGQLTCTKNQGLYTCENNVNNINGYSSFSSQNIDQAVYTDYNQQFEQCKSVCTQWAPRCKGFSFQQLPSPECLLYDSAAIINGERSLISPYSGSD